jgi:hypothetical protein
MWKLWTKYVLILSCIYLGASLGERYQPQFEAKCEVRNSIRDLAMMEKERQ